MVFPSDVVDEEEDYDEENIFQKAIASAKEKYFKNRSKKAHSSVAGLSKADDTNHPRDQNGYKKPLDAGAFSGRATANRRLATASRQFRPDIHGTAAWKSANEWEDGLRTSATKGEGQTGRNVSAERSVVSKLARRLLDAEQKPLAGPPKAFLDKINSINADDFTNAPPAAFGNKHMRREKFQKSAFDDRKAEPAAIPPPPVSLLHSEPTHSPNVVPERGFRDRLYGRNVNRESALSENYYNQQNPYYADDGYEIDPEFKADPPRKKKDVSNAEKTQLLKEHFQAREELDAVVQEMQANGNFLFNRHDDLDDTHKNRKRTQAAKRYESLQREKYGKNLVGKADAVEKLQDEKTAESDDEVQAVNEASADAPENKLRLPRLQRTKLVKKQHRQRTAEQQEENSLETNVVPKSARVLTKPPVALDCEFVGVGPLGVDDALARVSVVNEHGDVLYNKFVRPREAVTDYRTEVSGVRAKDVSANNPAAVDFSAAQRDIAELIAGRIIVGHAITNDLRALQLSHPRYFIRDTQTYKPFKRLGGASRPSLRKLAKAVLDLTIHGGEHDSIEDARIAMQLYMNRRKEWEHQLLHGEAKHYGKKRERQEEFNWHHGSKRLERRMPRDENGKRRRMFKGNSTKSAGGSSGKGDDVLMLGVTSGAALDR